MKFLLIALAVATMVSLWSTEIAIGQGNARLARITLGASGGILILMILAYIVALATVQE